MEVRGCRHLSEASEMLCNGLGVWFTAERLDCVWSLFNHMSGDNCIVEKWGSELFLRQLSSTREYIFVTGTPKRVTIICEENANQQTIRARG